MTVVTSGVGSYAQRRSCAADGRTESPPGAHQQPHNAAEKDHPPAGSGAFDSKPAQPDRVRCRSEPSPRARPTTNAKAEPGAAAARPAATEPPAHAPPRPSPTHHRTAASRRGGGSGSAPVGRSSRTEMRGGSRPTPAAVFLLAVAGICAQFAAGLRSRSACRPSDLGGAA